MSIFLRIIDLYHILVTYTMCGCFMSEECATSYVRSKHSMSLLWKKKVSSTRHQHAFPSNPRPSHRDSHDIFVAVQFFSVYYLSLNYTPVILRVRPIC